MRRRRACEFPGYDYSRCMEDKDWKKEYDLLEAEMRGLELDLEKAQDDLRKTHENHKKAFSHFKGEVNAKFELHREAISRLTDLLLKHGNHSPDCNLLSLKMSGRTVSIPEEEICSCGWIKLREEINEALKAGPLSKEEMDALINKYIKKSSEEPNGSL